jgi:hypothetical protein
MVAVLEYCTNMDCDFISSSHGRLHLWVGSLVGSEGVQTVCLIRFALSHTLEFFAKFALDPVLRSLKRRVLRPPGNQAVRRWPPVRVSPLLSACLCEPTGTSAVLKSQKIRMRLGGSLSLLDEFPDKPKGMHWRTYERWCRVHDVAEERSTIGLMRFVERLGRRTSPRA